jgi:hypothetical protein
VLGRGRHRVALAQEGGPRRRAPLGRRVAQLRQALGRGEVAQVADRLLEAPRRQVVAERDEERGARAGRRPAGARAGAAAVSSSVAAPMPSGATGTATTSA